jgi:hypothetical protein
MRCVRVLFATGLLSYGAMASADVGVSLRAGTLGAGAEFNVGLTEKLNLRLGYSFFDHDDTLEETDVVYDGELSLRNATALLDYHVFGGGFRLSFGAVGASTEIDVEAKPTGTYEIGDEVFTAQQVGRLFGKVKMGNDVAPYLGIGWGNTVDASDRITVLLDIGAVYTGSPEVNLTAICGPAAPQGSANCNRLQQEVEREEDEFADEATSYEWYPVIGLGLAIRF